MAVKKSKSEMGQIKLTVPEKMLQKLKQEKENFSYPSVQMIILEALRDRYFKTPKTGEKRGRPRKLDLMRVGSAKRVFE